jgi:hypothetical protein
MGKQVTDLLSYRPNMYDQDITIYTNQYGYEIYRHSGFLYTGINEYTLNYPTHLVEGGPFEICIPISSLFLNLSEDQVI